MSLGHRRPYHRLCRCRRIRLGGNEKLMNPFTRTRWARPLIFITPQIFTRILHLVAPTFCCASIQSAPRHIGGQLSFIGTLFAFLPLGNHHHLYSYDLHTFTLLCITHETYLSEDCVYPYFAYLSQRDFFGIWNVLFGLIMTLRTSELFVNHFFISFTPTASQQPSMLNSKKL